MTETKVVGNALHLEHLFPPPEEGLKTFQSFWSSPEKFADELVTYNKKDAWQDAAWEKDTGGWYGTNTFEEAIQLIRSGWKEGVDQVARVQGKVLARYPLQKKPARYGIVGSVPSVARAVAGNPLNMQIMDPKKASKRPIITLVSDIAALCNHSGEEMINRAAVVAALIDQIEAAGYCCEVITAAYSNADWRNDKFKYRAHIIVKESNQPVDIARLAFGLGHAGMFRRLIFAEKGYHQFCRDLGGGLGCTDKINIGGEVQKRLAEKNMYVIPSIQGTTCFTTEEKAETEGVEYILKALRSQKFPVFDYKGLSEEPLKEEDED